MSENNNSSASANVVSLSAFRSVTITDSRQESMSALRDKIIKIKTGIENGDVKSDHRGFEL